MNNEYEKLKISSHEQKKLLFLWVKNHFTQSLKASNL